MASGITPSRRGAKTAREQRAAPPAATREVCYLCGTLFWSVHHPNGKRTLYCCPTHRQYAKQERVAAKIRARAADPSQTKTKPQGDRP